jgi:hypothetical protein
MKRLLILKPIITSLFVCFTLFSFSQNMVFKPQGGEIQADLIGMDTFLVPFKGFDVPQPRYDYLWITNDGQYYFSGDSATVIHRFDVDKIGGVGSSAAFRTYATAIYSDHEDDEPPKIIIGDTPIGASPGVPASTGSLRDSGFVLLQKNHLNLVPEDTTVFIISAKNNLQDSFDFLNTYLLLLYDAPLSILSKDLSSSAISTLPVRGLATPPLYTSFALEQNLIYFPNTAPASMAEIGLSEISLGSSFRKAALYRLDELGPGEERHVYVQMKNSEVHLESIPSGGIGGTRFMAILLATDFQGEIDLPALSNNEAQLLGEIKLNSLLEQGIPVVNVTGGADTLFIGDYRPIGVSEVYSTVARSHDPNQIRLQACECPAESGAAHKIICRVDFENTGAGATEDVSITIPFPESIDVTTFDENLISLFPASSALEADMSITVNADSNTVTLDFPGLRLEGKVPGEDNYLNRTGHFAFTIYTRAGTDLNAIPAVQACITFDDNDPFCTPESKIELIGNQEVHESLSAYSLECGKCEVDKKTANDDYTVLGMPLWLLILILIMICIALYFAFFYEQD